MKITETALQGVFVIEPEPHSDQRGFFARTWCEREFAAAGLETRLVQSSVSFNSKKGTLRGMHYQIEPHEETKLVRCTRGSIWDAVLDLRPDSPNFLKHVSIVLSGANRKAIYVPRGFAHGFQTLEPETEVLYQMSEFYCADCARGVRWNDPAFGIEWPEGERTIIERDRTYPDFPAGRATVSAQGSPSD